MNDRLLSSSPHLIAALVTPFTTDGDIDRPSLVRLIGYLRREGVHEFFVAGSTGEAALLDEADRQTLIATVREAAPDALLYAGISGTGHRHAIRNARDAAQAGADVAVLMSPYFLSLAQNQLATFTCAVADASPVPLAVYHHLRMPTAFAVATVAQLAEHPNIVAIKDTNGSEHDRCAEILAAVAGRPFLFLQGVEKLALSTLEAGGHGGVFAQTCIAPRLFRALFEAWEGGRKQEASEIQSRLTALWGIFSRHEVKQSFFHFLQTLKLPLHQRGLLATTAFALPGVRIDESFDHFVSKFLEQHPDVAPVSSSG